MANHMIDLTPQKPNLKLLKGLMIAAGIYTVICLILALLKLMEWRFPIIGLLCLVSALLAWAPWKKDR